LSGSAGETFLLRCGNSIEFYVAFFAGFSLGRNVFAMGCDAVEGEVSQAIKRSRAHGIIGCGLQVKEIAEFSYPNPPDDDDGAPALMLQSSGTTGLPKIVRRPATTVDAAASMIAETRCITESDEILSCVPLAHSYGIEHGLLAPILVGATVHIAHGFEMSTIARELTARRITVFPAVPTIVEMLTQFDDLPSRLGGLRLIYSAGGPLPVSLNEKFVRRFGLRVGQIYGASEIGSVTFSDPDREDFDPGSVGRSMGGVEMKSDADGQLLVKAPSQMAGYVGEKSPFTSDGFFPTGDLARVDANNENITLTGRSKLLIDVGGRKVNPLEVEESLRMHPGIADCVVVGVRQSETLRRLKALYVARELHSAPTEEELRQFLKEHLSRYKIPRIFELCESLPRTAAGKIQRHLLEQA
jgi:acyl-coenzyme A synthetase/AMP-(fatty) acid ligase